MHMAIVELTTRPKASFDRTLHDEIECPRCNGSMILCSDFDGLYYACEECDFLLHAKPAWWLLVGRTLPTITNLIAYEYQNWMPFREKLGKKQKRSFDLMWSTAYRQRLAMMYANRPVPIQSIMMAILFEHYKQLVVMKDQLSTASKLDKVKKKGSPYFEEPSKGRPPVPMS